MGLFIFLGFVALVIFFVAGPFVTVSQGFRGCVRGGGRGLG